MTLLPIAAPTTPPNGQAAGDIAAMSGEFAALLALVAGLVPPPGEAALPDGALPEAAPSIPDVPEPAQSRGQGPAHPVEGPVLRVPASSVAVEASPVIVEAAPPANPPAIPPLPVSEAPQAGFVEVRPTPRYEARPAERDGDPPAVDHPQVEVSPPDRSRPVPQTLPASPDAPPAQAPASAVSGQPEAEAVVTPPVSSPRPERPAVRVPASPVAVEASPALSPQSGFPEPPLNPKQRVQEDPPGYRIPEKPVPEVTAPAPTPWPEAAIRAEAPIPADAPAAAPVAPPAIPDQIVSAVVPLHGRGDGRHEVTLELRPEELGTIRVDVSVEHQTVHLTLHAAEPATGRLLSAALADLRSALADAGLQAGHVAVSPDGGSGPGRRSRPQTDPETHLPGKATPTAAVPATSPTIRPARAGRLDLFL
jgi:hypothetical protein